MRHREQRKMRCGVAAVEAAIVLPVAFMFMFAIFDFGRAIATEQVLQNATHVAVRQAVVGTTTLTTSNIQTTVTNCMGGLALKGMIVQIYQADPVTGANIGLWTKAANGQCIAVQVTGTFMPIVPTFSLLRTSLSMSSKSMMTVEAN